MQILKDVSGNSLAVETGKPEEIFYDEIAEKYDKGYEYNLAIAENNFIINYALKNGLCEGKILDLGCGTGLLLDYIKKSSDEYFGIDISSNMLNVMKNKHPYASIEKMDIKDIGVKLRGQQYDNILSLFGSFTYVCEQETAIQGIYDLLKPGGKFFLMLSSDSFTKRKNYVGNKFKNEMKLITYNREMINDLFSQFRNLQVQGFNMFSEKLPEYLPVSFYNAFLRLEGFFLGKTIPYKHYYILLTGTR